MIKLFKELIVSSLYLYLFQVLNYVLPFLILPYLLNILSLGSFGIFAFSQSLIQLLILIVDFGFNLSVSKRIAELPKNSAQIPIIYWEVICAKICLFLLVSLVVFISFSTFSALSVYKHAVFLSLITLLGTALFPVWLYLGLNEMKLMSFITATSKLLTLPFVFLFVKGPEDYLPAVILHSASFLLAGLISFSLIISRRNYRRDFKSRSAVGRQIILHIKESWHFFLSNVSITLYTNSLTILLGFFGNPGQVGVFAAIERVVRILCFAVYVPINQAAFPVIARLKSTDFNQAVLVFRVLFYSIALAMAMIILFFSFFGAAVTNEFFDQKIDEGIMRIALFSILPIALGAACGQLGLVALGGEAHKNTFSKIYIYTGLISLPLCLISIRFFYVNGAVFSMMVTEFSIFTCMLVSVKKYKLL